MAVRWSAEPGQELMVDGVRLEYACFGPPPGGRPTLVLLHEGLGCTALWRDFPERLSEQTGLGVFVWSRAGYGRSDAVSLPRPLDYMTREATHGLGPAMDAAGLGDVILAGHSDGATIAAIYAGSVSDPRVRGLILIAPHFFAEPEGLAAIRSTGETWKTGDLQTRMARYHDHPDVAFRGWYEAWTDPRFLDWSVADCIDHWRVPVLAIQGQDDPYGTMAQIDEIRDRIYAPLEVFLPDGCGHAPHLEVAQATIDAVSDFCARLIRMEETHVGTG